MASYCVLLCILCAAIYASAGPLPDRETIDSLIDQKRSDLRYPKVTDVMRHILKKRYVLTGIGGSMECAKGEMRDIDGVNCISCDFFMALEDDHCDFDEFKNSCQDFVKCP